MAWDDFVKTDVSEQFVSYCTKMGAPFSLMSRSFSDRLVEKGDSISVPVLSDIVSTSRTKNDGEEYDGDNQEPTPSSITLTDQNYVGAKFSASQMSKMRRMANTVTELARLIAHEFWTQVYASFFSKLVTAAPVAAGNTWFNDSGTMFDLAELINLNKLRRKEPGWGSGCEPSVILGPDLHAGLLPELMNHPSLQKIASEALEEAHVRRLMGLNLADYDLVPEAGEDLGGIVMKPDGVGIAFAVAAVAGRAGEGSLIDYDYIQVPGTDMWITYREIYDGKKDERFYIWEVVWGVKVFKPENIRYLVDTDLAAA